MKTPTRFLMEVLPLPILMAASPAAIADCLVFEGPSKFQPIAIEIAPGVSAEATVSYYDRTTGLADVVDAAEVPSCQVSVDVRLSSFPSSRVAMRPSDVAPAIRDIAKEWHVKECVITVWYENDTTQEMAEQEQCVTGTFGFDGRASWPTSSERSCWEATGATG
jgi:hypothetical protein